jgi:predicted kinase
MELVIFVGLQGAGKTSFYRERFAATHVHVSKDLFPSPRDRSARQRREIEAALGAGRSVVVDNTNPTPADRAPLVEHARMHGARVVCYWFEAAPAECLARNATRAGRARVPPAAIFATHGRLVAPTLDEGFDALYHVRVAADGSAVVSDGP